MESAELSPEQVTAYEVFYRGHYRPVLRSLSLTLNSDDLGREAADESFTRAYERWGDVVSYDNAPGWVYRVGYNWAISRMRRRHRDPLPGLSDPVHYDPRPLSGVRSSVGRLACRSASGGRPSLLCRLEHQPDRRVARDSCRHREEPTESGAEVAPARPGLTRNPDGTFCLLGASSGQRVTGSSEWESRTGSRTNFESTCKRGVRASTPRQSHRAIRSASTDLPNADRGSRSLRPPQHLLLSAALVWHLSRTLPTIWRPTIQIPLALEKPPREGQLHRLLRSNGALYPLILWISPFTTAVRTWTTCRLWHSTKA